MRRVADLHASSATLRPDPHYLDHPQGEHSLLRRMGDREVRSATSSSSTALKAKASHECCSA